MSRTPIKAYLGTKPLFTNIIRSSDSYERPSDWLPLPAAPEPQGLRILMAVFNTDINLMAIQCRGSFVVDWGDGSSPVTYTDNTVANYNYNWNNISSSTYSVRGYRQAIITVTPNTGSNLTNVTFPKPTNIPNAVLNNVYGIGMLDVNMNLPFFTSTSRLIFGGNNTLKPFLERVNIKSLGGLVNATNMFYFCHSLQSLNEHEWDTSKWTSIQHMFHTNRKLTYLDTRNWNLSAVTNMDGIFTNCDQLLEIAGIENWNVENVSQFSSLFSGCLRFRGSSSGILDLSNWNVTNKATTFYRMFQITRNLNKVIFGNWDTRNVTNASEMFSNSVITELDMSMLNLSAATTVADMFINARSNLRQLILPTLPLSATFNSTGFLRDACSLSSLTFSNSGINNSISFFNCAFSANSLNYIFQNLSNTGSGKTVNVALNPGLSGVGFNPTIATNKGWTVIS